MSRISDRSRVQSLLQLLSGYCSSMQGYLNRGDLIVLSNAVRAQELAEELHIVVRRMHADKLAKV